MDIDETKKYFEIEYDITLKKCEEGGYFVKINDLPGCMSQGETQKEAFEMIEDAKRCWIEVALERGIEIPKPGSYEASQK